MSVIVKGMEMPKSCDSCRFNISSLSCAITGSCIDRDDEYRERLSDCPISALPDNHGRLVDADDTIKEIKARNPDDVSYEDAWAITCIEHAPTIIESEGECESG